MEASQDDFQEAPDRATLLRGQWAAAVAEVLDEWPEPRKPPLSTTFAQNLTEVSWTWVTTALAPDLEAFARHSNRAQVGPADVVLAARKNEVTHAIMEQEAGRLRSVKQKVVPEARGTETGKQD